MTVLNHTITGTGPSIVFLHGLGTSGWMWEPQVSDLAQDYTCITIDLPNCGGSHQSQWRSFEDSADQVAHILKSLPAPAHVVGLSLGGYVALRVLERHPDLVASCVTTGASVRPLMPNAVMAPLAVVLSYAVKWPWLGRKSAAMMQMDAQSTAAYLNDLSLLRPRDVRRIYTQLNRFEPPQLSPKDAQKLLFVAGEKEAKAILQSVKDISALHPEAQTGLAAGLHHPWSAQDPKLFNDMVRAWATERRNILLSG